MGYRKQDQENALLDLAIAERAVETQTALSSSAITFSASIVPGKLHFISNCSTSTVAYVTLNGTAPVVGNGSGAASMGHPLMPLEKLPLYYESGSYTLKAITESGTARVVLSTNKGSVG